MNLPALAHALGGKVTGRNRISCPGPGHSPGDLSLGVLLDPSAPDGFVCHSYAGDDALACKDFVRSRLGLPEPERRSKPISSSQTGILSRGHRHPSEADFAVLDDRSAADDDRARSKRALALWDEARSLTGTPAESYLRRRGIDFAVLDDGTALKWHPECPFGKARVGCMVALVRDIVTNEERAIHRTAIDRDGRKRSDLGSNGRLALGPVAGGAVKITPDEDVTLAVAIGEGIESCLSLGKLTDLVTLPIWACLSAGQVARFPVLPGIETLWLVVDHDKAGVEACRAASDRWRDAGREVVEVTPTLSGSDLNDAIGGQADA